MYPSHEVVKPVCFCGKELSSLSYMINGRQSFQEFITDLKANNIQLSDNLLKTTPFYTEIDREALLRSMKLKWCCLSTIRAGGTYSVSVFQSNEDGSAKSKVFASCQRKYPEALPKPFSSEETLFWKT